MEQRFMKIQTLKGNVEEWRSSAWRQNFSSKFTWSWHKVLADPKGDFVGFDRSRISNQSRKYYPS